jgi:hypothetical protein
MLEFRLQSQRPNREVNGAAQDGSFSRLLGPA